MNRIIAILGSRAPLWFGINARQTLKLYLRASGLLMFVLLMIALTIDMAKYLPDVRQKSADLDQPLLQVLLPYLTYRGVDIITRLLPMACFLGLFLAEILRATRLEKTILAQAGFSPLLTMRILLLFALIVGGVQTALETRLRPMAVFAQVDLGLGAYGYRFKQGLGRDPVWFVIGETALHARISRSPTPEMREIEIFRGINQNGLSSVILADRATPIGPHLWRFENVTEWTPEWTPANDASDTPKSGDYQSRRIALMDIPLDLLPEQLTYHNIQGYYLPSGDLAKIATMRAATTASDADTALWRRLTALFLPGAFAFLGASLAQAGTETRRPSLPLLIFFALVGYLSIVSVKVLWALGELGVMPASLAVSGSIAITLALAILLQIRQTLPRLPRLRWPSRKK